MKEEKHGNEAFSGVLELVVLAVCWCAVVLIASMNSPPSAYAAERIILAGECENDLIACKCCLYDIYMLAVWRKWKSKENFKLEFFFDSSSLKQHFLVSILYNFQSTHAAYITLAATVNSHRSHETSSDCCEMSEVWYVLCVKFQLFCLLAAIVDDAICAMQPEEARNICVRQVKGPRRVWVERVQPEPRHRSIKQAQSKAELEV